MLLKFSTRLLGDAMETLKDWQFLVAAVITVAVALWHYFATGKNHLNTEPAKSAILCAIVVFPLSLLLSLLLVLTPDQRAVLGDWWDPIGKAIVSLYMVSLFVAFIIAKCFDVHDWFRRRRKSKTQPP